MERDKSPFLRCVQLALIRCGNWFRRVTQAWMGYDFVMPAEDDDYDDHDTVTSSLSACLATAVEFVVCCLFYGLTFAGQHQLEGRWELLMMLGQDWLDLIIIVLIYCFFQKSGSNWRRKHKLVIKSKMSWRYEWKCHNNIWHGLLWFAHVSPIRETMKALNDASSFIHVRLCVDSSSVFHSWSPT